MQQVYKPSFDEIRTMAEQGNVIAVHRELPADLETPVSVYLKLRKPRPRPQLPAGIRGKGRDLGPL